MPDDSVDDEKWLRRMLLLLPGFLSLAIARHIVNSGELDSFSLTSYSLVFSLVNFALAFSIVLLARYLASVFSRRAKRTHLTTLPPPTLPFIATVLTTAIILGVIAGYAYSSDVILVGLRQVPFVSALTKRSVERPLTFLLATNRQGNLEEGRPEFIRKGEAWIEVHSKSGQLFSGYPNLFSMGEEEAEIFLSPACTVSNEVQALPGPGVLIREDEIHYILFVDRQASDCYEIWAGISQPGVKSTGHTEKEQPLPEQ